MTVPQLLLVVEEQERDRLRLMLDTSDAVAAGAATLFDDKHPRSWRDKIISLLEA